MEREAAESDVARGMAGGGAGPGRESALRFHRGLEAQHRRHRRRGSVERPVESTEGDHRRSHRGLGEDHHLGEAQRSGRGRARERPEHPDVGAGDQEHAPKERLLAKPGGLVLQPMEVGSPIDESVDDPGGEAEETKLLGGRGIDGEAVGIVGIALGAPHFVGIAIAPDGALTQEPVRRKPRAREHERRPPGVRGENHGAGEAAEKLDEPARDEVHRNGERRTGHAQIEVPGHGEVARELRVLEMAHARGPHAGFGEPVVEPRGGAVPEVRAHRLVDGSEHLEEHENPPGEAERRGERLAALDRRDEPPHRDGENRRQDASQEENAPPEDGERKIGFRKDGEELPLVPRGQAFHGRRIRESLASRLGKNYEDGRSAAVVPSPTGWRARRNSEGVIPESSRNSGTP